jgi:hypothetical protein
MRVPDVGQWVCKTAGHCARLIILHISLSTKVFWGYLPWPITDILQLENSIWARPYHQVPHILVRFLLLLHLPTQNSTPTMTFLPQGTDEHDLEDAFTKKLDEKPSLYPAKLFIVIHKPQNGVIGF